MEHWNFIYYYFICSDLLIYFTISKRSSSILMYYIEIIYNIIILQTRFAHTIHNIIFMSSFCTDNCHTIVKYYIKVCWNVAEKKTMKKKKNNHTYKWIQRTPVVLIKLKEGKKNIVTIILILFNFFIINYPKIHLRFIPMRYKYQHKLFTEFTTILLESFAFYFLVFFYIFVSKTENFLLSSQIKI